ncbi:tol-pal system protein YbgF [Fulvimarina sp. 2208YS6-2-32]|uniref:Cell division coordinator CpoB n=1 Tax=Fulvimarina uroteuthidis TaxID=3098149 RepID=A0ABU5I6F7_9HYPH|nr:tol-pal system protein YbgF [Fulvimarina sp. 2208YS6-2-32]MDY8110972.1 tol-pal system protein YbgF [Fulvimarina sp. 2208YS6-2-32]
MIRRPNLFAVLASAAFLSAPLPAWAFAPAATTFQAAPAQARQGDTAGAPVLLAQAGDTLSRIQRLEDEVRRLNGRVEELSFQLLQAQEDMRKAQENNELRFQDLEQGAGAGGTGDGLPQQRGDLDTGTTGGQAGGTPDADIAAIIGDTDLPAASPDVAATAPVPPSDQPVTLPSGAATAVYESAYDQLLAGDYQSAEQSFRQYVQTYPGSPNAPDAQYWLGESLFQQQRYADAAEVFLNAQKATPEATKAPDMMLKLGMSLAALGNAETACITYREVESRYPQMNETLRTKLDQERKSANC